MRTVTMRRRDNTSHPQHNLIFWSVSERFAAGFRWGNTLVLCGRDVIDEGDAIYLTGHDASKCREDGFYDDDCCAAPGSAACADGYTMTTSGHFGTHMDPEPCFSTVDGTFVAYTTMCAPPTVDTAAAPEPPLPALAETRTFHVRLAVADALWELLTNQAYMKWLTNLRQTASDEYSSFARGRRCHLSVGGCHFATLTHRESPLLPTMNRPK